MHRLILLVFVAVAVIYWRGENSPKTGPTWIKKETPILIADQPWEVKAVSEPTVLYDGVLWRMWYMGGWHQSAIGYAESDDGQHWRKHNGPVLGIGASGISIRTGHSFVMHRDGLFYIFFAGIGDHPSIYAAESTDGVNWSSITEILQPGEQDTALANMVVWVEGSMWRMIYESRDRSGKLWTMGLVEGTDAYHWRKVVFPLPDLSVGGSAGGPAIEHAENGYRLTYHAAPLGDAPTYIYQAESSDLLHWRVLGRVLDISLGPWEVDQVADPNLVGNRMYYAAMNNPAESGAIMLATR